MLQLAKVLEALERVQRAFNDAQSGDKRVSMADLVVLGGCAAIEQAAKAADVAISVPFTPGRNDATQDQTDTEALAVLEPLADGFRNYQQRTFSVTAEALLIDKAQLLNLSAPQMTALVGGLRVLGTNAGDDHHGILTDHIGTLTNDFFVNLLSMATQWHPIADDESLFEARDRDTGTVKWTGTRVDLVFGSNSQLRALAEVYASADGKTRFIEDFVAAWDKVMNLDRFDLA